MTALIAASDVGNAEMVDLLVKAGADVESQTEVMFVTLIYSFAVNTICKITVSR